MSTHKEGKSEPTLRWGSNPVSPTSITAGTRPVSRLGAGLETFLSQMVWSEGTRSEDPLLSIALDVHPAVPSLLAPSRTPSGSRLLLWPLALTALGRTSATALQQVSVIPHAQNGNSTNVRLVSRTRADPPDTRSPATPSGPSGRRALCRSENLRVAARSRDQPRITSTPQPALEGRSQTETRGRRPAGPPERIPPEAPSGPALFKCVLRVSPGESPVWGSGSVGVYSSYPAAVLALT